MARGKDHLELVNNVGRKKGLRQDEVVENFHFSKI